MEVKEKMTMTISEILTSYAPAIVSCVGAIGVYAKLKKAFDVVKGSVSKLSSKAKENDKVIESNNNAVIKIEKICGDTINLLKSQIEKQESVITKLKDDLANTRSECSLLKEQNKELKEIKQQLAQHLLNEECKN